MSDEFEPGDDQLLVRVEASVVGRPELRALRSGGVITPGGAGVGVVERAGSSALDLVGVRVVVPGVQPCGECDVCRRGAAGVCPAGAVHGVDIDGTLSPRVVTGARWACRVDGELMVPGPAAALLGREAAVAYAMFIALGTAPGDPAVILGSGPVARLLIDIATARGAKPLAPDATFVPANALLASDTGSLADRLRAGAREAGCGAAPWRIFDTTGTAAGRARAVTFAGPGARLALCAAADAGDDSLPLAALLTAGATVVCVPAAHPDLLPELAAMAAKGEIDLSAAMTPHPPRELAELTVAVTRGEREGTAPIVVYES